MTNDETPAALMWTEELENRLRRVYGEEKLIVPVVQALFLLNNEPRTITEVMQCITLNGIYDLPERTGRATLKYSINRYNSKPGLSPLILEDVSTQPSRLWLDMEHGVFTGRGINEEQLALLNRRRKKSQKKAVRPLDPAAPTSNRPPKTKATAGKKAKTPKPSQSLLQPAVTAQTTTTTTTMTATTAAMGTAASTIATAPKNKGKGKLAVDGLVPQRTVPGKGKKRGLPAYTPGYDEETVMEGVGIVNPETGAAVFPVVRSVLPLPKKKGRPRKPQQRPPTPISNKVARRPIQDERVRKAQKRRETRKERKHREAEECRRREEEERLRRKRERSEAKRRRYDEQRQRWVAEIAERERQRQARYAEKMAEIAARFPPRPQPPLFRGPVVSTVSSAQAPTTLNYGWQLATSEASGSLEKQGEGGCI